MAEEAALSLPSDYIINAEHILSKNSSGCTEHENGQPFFPLIAIASMNPVFPGVRPEISFAVAGIQTY